MARFLKSRKVVRFYDVVRAWMMLPTIFIAQSIFVYWAAGSASSRLPLFVVTALILALLVVVIRLTWGDFREFYTPRHHWNVGGFHRENRQEFKKRIRDFCRDSNIIYAEDRNPINELLGNCRFSFMHKDDLIKCRLTLGE